MGDGGGDPDGDRGISFARRRLARLGLVDELSSILDPKDSQLARARPEGLVSGPAYCCGIKLRIQSDKLSIEIENPRRAIEGLLGPCRHRPG